MQLYPQQSEALDAMIRFVRSEDSVFILKGYAGTGKTTVIRMLCEQLKDFGRIPKLMAPTGRAAKVLGGKTGVEATTVHKAIYHRVKFEVFRHDDVKGNVDDMDIYFDVRRITEESEAGKMVVIVDEASLVSSRPARHEVIHFGTDILMTDLLTYAQTGLGTKLIFVGDPAQLPPVGDNQSAALDEEYFEGLGISVRSFTLTEVVRQKGESMILANAMKVRDLLNSAVRNQLCFETKAGEVEAVSSVDVVEKYIALLPHPALNQSVVICYSNAHAQDYNHAIRQRYFADKVLGKGDILQIIRNNYSEILPEGYLMNGDFIRIASNPGEEEIHKVPVWIDNEGRSERVYMELKFQSVEFETDCGVKGSAKILTNILYNTRPSLTREESVALYIDFVIRHSELHRGSEEFAQASVDDPYYNALQAKFGYAITGHKSQGGEWRTVFVDYSGRTGLDDNSLRWNYTATTRAAECLYGVNFPHVTPFRKFNILPVKYVSKAQEAVICIKDSRCVFLPPDAAPARKAKCNSVAAALENRGYRLLSVKCMPYRDRYVIEGPSGQKEYDYQYNGCGIYTVYSSLKPSDEDAEIFEALSDESCYDYECQYIPSKAFLEELRCAVVSAADETGVRITGIKEFPDQYYVLYGLRTSVPFSTIQFYFNGKGFVTRAIPASALGTDDTMMLDLLTRIQKLSCL